MSQTSQRRRTRRHHFAAEITSVFFSSAFAKTMVAPIERVKLLLQNQNLVYNLEKNSYKGIFDTIKRVEAEQGFLSFFRGNGVNIFRILPNSIIRFYCFERLNRIFLHQNQEYSDFDRNLRKIASASTSGIITVALTYPLDLVRTRLALDVARTGEPRHYDGTISCIKKVAKSEGISAIYKGFWVSCLGIVPFITVSLTTYDLLKPFVFDSNLTESESLMSQTVQFLGAGTIAGMVAQLTTYPLDTIRRRMQLNGGQGLQKAYRSSFDCIKKIVMTEGIKGFYKGIIPSLVKIAPAAALQFSAYEIVREQFWN